MSSLILTMVLPAPNGCNLKCPFCAIAQRGEAREQELTDGDYLRFLRGVATSFPVSSFTLQGYEPLLPESWDLTRALLQAADTFDLGTGLVTNGVTLAEHASELAGLADTVTVSLDSHDGIRHDRLRGVIGAWKSTVDGIHGAVEHFGSEGVTVNSVLFPKKLAYLAGMPALLRRLGVTNWVVSPLIDFRKDAYASDLSQLHQDLLLLSDLAKAEGVELFLADEFRRYESTDLYQSLSVAAVESDDFVVRLSPDGTLSRGREILRESSHAPKWDRVEEPARFLARVLVEVGRTFD